jgi:hypothetical protein
VVDDGEEDERVEKRVEMGAKLERRKRIRLEYVNVS